MSSTFPGSKAVGPVEYQVPAPLQPFKVKVTVNQEDGAFVVYWAEPFVPLMIGRYYYQVGCFSMLFACFYWEIYFIAVSGNGALWVLILSYIPYTLTWLDVTGDEVRYEICVKVEFFVFWAFGKCEAMTIYVNFQSPLVFTTFFAKNTITSAV